MALKVLDWLTKVNLITDISHFFLFICLVLNNFLHSEEQWSKEEGANVTEEGKTYVL